MGVLKCKNGVDIKVRERIKLSTWFVNYMQMNK